MLFWWLACAEPEPPMTVPRAWSLPTTPPSTAQRPDCSAPANRPVPGTYDPERRACAQPDVDQGCYGDCPPIREKLIELLPDYLPFWGVTDDVRSLVVERCVGALDGQPYDRVAWARWTVDDGWADDWIFHPDGRPLFIHSRYQSIRDDGFYCCESSRRVPGRTWGPPIALDCSAAVPYAPEDFFGSGGTGASVGGGSGP